MLDQSRIQTSSTRLRPGNNRKGPHSSVAFSLPSPPSYLRRDVSITQGSIRHRRPPSSLPQPMTSNHSSSVNPSEKLSTDDDPPWIAQSSSGITPDVPARYLSPHTSRGFCEDLLRLLHSDPPPPLSELLRYHASYGPLQSVKSYNLLISVALWHNQWGLARKLLNRMEFANIPPDVETRKLRARLLIRTGSWLRAWRQECSASENEGSPLPFPVWTEFFGTTKHHGFRRTKTITTSDGKASTCPMPISRSEIEDPDTHLNQTRLLLQHLPNVKVENVNDVPARIIRSVVRAALSCDHMEYANALTERYFRTLPAIMQDAQFRQCTEIIHLHIIHVHKRGLARYHGSMRILRRYLPLHPQLRPTPKTLLCVLATLRGTKNAGSFAQRVAESFKKRWGSDVIDDRVRRRIASLALKEGRLDIAQAQLNHQSISEPRQELRPLVCQHTESTRRRTPILPRIRYIYSGRNKEGWRWRILRRRVWQRVRTRALPKRSDTD